ncbi:DUF4386 domain-containing protein [Nonomuraea sp. SYSU D8015]|uniref:DUF4386 domain-containing protein n=1 Tax=Nonomuraea sp. SYSU D8015 TaxID=2593644 RepID=UPI0016616DA9|nr:DUF4386 domain-containing protein [Nonomuraea sp. SYSU D8015]
MVVSEAAHQPVRRAALVAGIALLALAVLAGLANFGVVENLVTAGDAEKTAQAIRDSEALFRYGVAGLLLAAVLDVVVAWALMVVFKPAREGVATLAAWLRAVYAGVFVVAIAQLAGAPSLAAQGSSAEALLKIDTFHDIWDAGLTLFGLHLLLLGYLAYASDYAPKLLGVLLAIAGLGYLVDHFGAFAFSGYSLEVAMFTFVGEVALMIWLLVKGRGIALGKTIG